LVRCPAGSKAAAPSEIATEGGDPDAIFVKCRVGLERAIREAEAARAAVKVKRSASLPAAESFW